jgi:hypothetical protein
MVIIPEEAEEVIPILRVAWGFLLAISDYCLSYFVCVGDVLLSFVRGSRLGV